MQRLNPADRFMRCLSLCNEISNELITDVVSLNKPQVKVSYDYYYSVSNVTYQYLKHTQTGQYLRIIRIQHLI